MPSETAMPTGTIDWYGWHEGYDEIESTMTRRLAVVQERVADALDHVPAGRPVRIISIAAGQSRDLLPVLIDHPAGQAVRALLVELDARNAEFAEGAVASTALRGVSVRVADAGIVDVYADAVPADLVLASGLFEVLPPEEIRTTIDGLGQFCAPGAMVIWTGSPCGDAGPSLVESWFAAAGFQVSAPQVGDGDDPFAVGTARWTGPTDPWQPGRRMFALR